MKIVQHYKLGADPVVIGELAPEEVELFSQEGQEQQQLLKRLYGSWILCECGVPTTIKRMNDSQHHFLARVKGRGAHKHCCRLFTLSSEKGSEAQANLGQASTNFSFSVRVPDSQAVTSVVKHGGDNQGKITRTDKLYTLVANLLTHAGSNTITLHKPPNFRDEVDHLKKAARKFSLGSKSLYEYLFIGFGQLKEAIEHLKSKEGLWLSRHLPQAIVLAHVKGIEVQGEHYEVLVKDGWQVKLSRKVMMTRLNGRFSLSKGPLLLAMVVSKNNLNGTPEYGISRAFISPVMNDKGFFIVDSDLERTFARITTKQLLSSRSTSEISKPLIPHIVENTPVIPDFIFNNQQEKVAFEVMGHWNDESYRVRKERMMPLFAELYDRIETVGTESAENKEAFYQEASRKIAATLE